MRLIVPRSTSFWISRSHLRFLFLKTVLVPAVCASDQFSASDPTISEGRVMYRLNERESEPCLPWPIDWLSAGCHSWVGPLSCGLYQSPAV